MCLRSKQVSESVILFHDLDCGSVGDFCVLSDFYTRNIGEKNQEFSVQICDLRVEVGMFTHGLSPSSRT